MPSLDELDSSRLGRRDRAAARLDKAIGELGARLGSGIIVIVEEMRLRVREHPSQA